MREQFGGGTGETGSVSHRQADDTAPRWFADAVETPVSPGLFDSSGDVVQPAPLGIAMDPALAALAALNARTTPLAAGSADKVAADNVASNGTADMAAVSGIAAGTAADVMDGATATTGRAAILSTAATRTASDAATPAPSATAVSGSFFDVGDLVISVYGDGDGSGSYGDNQAAPIVLQEITTDGSVVRQLVLPQTTTVVNGVTEYAVSGEYGSSSEGTLELSADGRSLVIAGYAVNADTYNAGGAAVYGNAALAQSTSVLGGAYTPVARVIADIGADGSVDSSTALYGINNTNNPRSVATVDGSSFYVSGQGVKGDTTQGVFVAADGASSATAIDTSTDTRTVEISNGTLYVSRDSKQGNSASISSYGGLPTGATTATVLPGLSGTVKLTAAQANTVNASAVGTKVNLSPENFFFANSTTLYVSDSGAPKTGSGLGDGGLQKWSLVNGSWTLDYTLSQGLNLVSNKAASGTTGLIGLTGKVSGDTVTLYATNATVGDLDQTYLFGITDSLSATTSAGQSFTTLVAAAADTNIRGVAFAPGDVNCFAAGTLILTADGEQPVEALQPGDIVLSPRDGGFREAPVRWVGRRTVDVARHPDPERVRPIRFAPGAIADGVPSRPLLVSPDHALLLDGLLVPARLLVNGASIVVEAVDSVTYLHVELDRHDILLAENAPAESFLDTGTRAQFTGEVQALHPVFDRAWHPDACAPLATDAAIVRPIHRRLAERAAAGPVAAVATTRDANLVLVMPDGTVIAPFRVGDDGSHGFWFDGRAGETVLLLRSRAQAPAGLRPWLDDRRRLGVGVSAVRGWFRDTGLDPVAVPFGPATGMRGWWDVDGLDLARWTDGEATLRLPPGCLRLDVTVAATTDYALAA